MRQHITGWLAGLIIGAVMLAGCSITTTEAAPTLRDEPDITVELDATVEPVRVESLRAPEIAVRETKVIYEQAQRTSLGGQNTMFWPDGNIGFVPVGDGQYRFFVANGSLTARTTGTFDAPGKVVEASKYAIEGASSEFAYLAGGPVYRDPETGQLILLYHAERHFGGSGIPFHSAIGLAASDDEGRTFRNLGIILETNAEPSAAAPCCADMGGAPFAIKDGTFYLYFRDRSKALEDIQLALATAPVEEVVAAAREGRTSEWAKYSTSGPQPGLGGLPTPLETGNPQTNWFSVSYNTMLERFIMAISRNGGPGDPSYLYLTASEDGISWSPRILLQDCECELTYPSIIDPDGNPLETGDTIYVYYITTPPTEQYRWHNTSLQRMAVTLTGRMVEMPHEWEFDTDPEGWVPLYDIGRFEVVDGLLVIEPTGNDPYMQSPFLGLSSTDYTTIEVRMRAEMGGTGQFFFTSTEASNTTEVASVRFPIKGSGQLETYTIDMSAVEGWSGLIGTLRFDPIDRETRVEIEYIRVMGPP